MVGQGEEKKQGHSELVKSEKKEVCEFIPYKIQEFRKKIESFPQEIIVVDCGFIVAQIWVHFLKRQCTCFFKRERK